MKTAMTKKFIIRLMDYDIINGRNVLSLSNKEEYNFRGYENECGNPFDTEEEAITYLNDMDVSGNYIILPYYEKEYI